MCFLGDVWKCVTIWQHSSLMTHSFWFSLSFSEALFMKRRLIHTKVMNASDEPWSNKPQIGVSLQLLPSRDPTPLTGNDFNLTAAEVYEVKNRLMNHINLTQIHHRTKPSLLFWFIFQKTSTTKLQRCVLPFFLSVVFVCCECVVNKTLLHGQVHSEWIGW